MHLLAPILRVASGKVYQNLQVQRHLSFRRIFAAIFKTSEEPKATTTAGGNMASIEELKLERQQLEDKVRDLVGKLEERKKPEEIRLKPDQILKSKEELEALAAMEKLELKTKAAEASTKTAPEQPAPQSKKSEQKPAKSRGQPAAKEPEKPLDVSRLDLRIGKIVEVDKHPDADALYLEKIDCGDPTGPRTVISGLVNHVPIEQMRDRLVVVLCNLKPAKMRGILSEAMVMCASTPEKVELLGVPEGVKPGDRVIFEKYPGEPDAQLNPKKKIWEQVAPDIKTNEEGVAMYKDCPFKASSVDGAFKSNLKNVQIR